MIHCRIPFIFAQNRLSYLKDEADVERDDGALEYSLIPFTVKSSSPSKLTCWELAGCAQQTVRKPLQDPCTTP